MTEAETGISGNMEREAQTARSLLTLRLFDLAAKEKPGLREMKALIDAGADVNGRDEKAHTVLMVAITANNKEAAALLIERGADMYASNNVATRANAMFYALASDDPGMVHMLLDKNFDPNSGPCHGKMTPLMWAAHFGKLELCEELVRRGADINSRSAAGNRTAADYAEDNQTPRIAQRLREMDAGKQEEQRKREEQAAALKAEFESLCDAGLPVRDKVRLLPPIMLKSGAPK